MNPRQWHLLLGECQNLGFDLVGVSSARSRKTAPAFSSWLRNNRHGEMKWMERSAQKRSDPKKILPRVKSIISLGVQYHLHDIPLELLNDPSRGIIARYALVDDYHRILKNRLEQLEAEIKKIFFNSTTRSYVDTGPILERDVAREAGLGFIGRNTQLIQPDLGSYLFLGEILIDQEIPLSKQDNRGTCSACQRCKTACPTNAIIDDRTIDARRCISYLTIELRRSIPEHFRPLMKNRIYGCDICQEVCPWNKKANLARQSIFNLRKDLVAPKLIELAFLTEDAYKIKFKNSPVKRAKYHGLLRNVAVALGNWGVPEAQKALSHLTNHPHPLVREHAQTNPIKNLL